MKIELNKTLLDSLARYRSTSVALREADYSSMSVDEIMDFYNANRDAAHVLAIQLDIAVGIAESEEVGL